MASLASRKYMVYTGTMLIVTLGLLQNFLLWNEIPLQNLLNYLFRTSYRPHHNIIFYGSIKGILLVHYIYCIFAINFIVLWILDRIMYIRHRFESEKTSINTLVHLSACFCACLLLLIQLCSVMRTWSYEMRSFSNKTEGAKIGMTTIGKPFRIASFYKSQIQGPLNTAFTTDLDLSKDPGMLMHRSLAFYLYPIDIRQIRNGKTDSWIAFEKENAAQFVPEGYTIAVQYDPKNLIAVRNP